MKKHGAGQENNTYDTQRGNAYFQYDDRRVNQNTTQRTRVQQDSIPAVPNASTAYAANKSVKRSKQRRKGQAFYKVLVFLVVVSVALVVLISTVFRLNQITIHGRVNRSAEDIVMKSGLVRGRNVLFIKEEDVRAEMAKDHTLIFLGMQKAYPDEIHISIEERNSVAVMQWAGIRYTLDDTGMVMDENNSIDTPVTLPLVLGFKVNYVTVGNQLIVSNQKQMEAYKTIMYELYEQMCGEMITEINVSDVENIYLLTADGTTVKLGTSANMTAKIGTLKSFVAYMRQLGDSTGYFDVSSEIEGKFRPEI